MLNDEDRNRLLNSLPEALRKDVCFIEEAILAADVEREAGTLTQVQWTIFMTLLRELLYLPAQDDIIHTVIRPVPQHHNGNQETLEGSSNASDCRETAPPSPSCYSVSGWFVTE